MPAQRGGAMGRKRKQDDMESEGSSSVKPEKQVVEPPRSSGILKSSVDLFSEPVIDTTTKRSNYEEFGQTQTNMNPTVIKIPGSQDFVDLTKTTLSFEVEFVGIDGTRLPRAAKVAPVNNVGHSLIRQMKLTFNGQNVCETSEDTYHLQAYLERKLQYGPHEKQFNMTSEGWYDDSPGKINVLDPTPRLATAYQLGSAAFPGDADATPAQMNTWMNSLLGQDREEILAHNQGAYARHKLCCNGQTVRFVIYPALPIMHCKRLLPPGVSMEFTIYWNSPEMVLNADQSAGNNANYKQPRFNIIPNTPKISVYNVRIQEAMHLQIEQQMLVHQNIAKYPHLSRSLKTHTIIDGRRENDWRNVFNGKCPNYMIVGYVRGAALTGSYEYAFTNFEDLNQSSIRVTRDGEEIPHGRMSLNDVYKEEAFNALLKFTGSGIESAPLGISKETYKLGSYLILYNFNPDGDLNFTHDYDRNTGNVNIHTEFSQNTAHNTTIVVLGYFENQGWLDGNKNFALKHGLT